MTKEWIRLILSGEKRLLKKSEIKPVDMGHYPEVSVKALYTDYSERPAIKPYMPPKLHKGRQCDKEYFFTVVNSICEGEITAIIHHANHQRNNVDEGELQKESITMTQEWQELMSQFPWASVSTLIFFFLTISFTETKRKDRLPAQEQSQTGQESTGSEALSSPRSDEANHSRS